MLNFHDIKQLKQSLNSKSLNKMISYQNNNVNIPWVWSVAQRLEQQPRQLKMWGSIPYHAHNFLIRFAICVRTTIEYMITIKYLLKSLAIQKNTPILTAVCNFGVLGLGAVCSAFSEALIYTYIYLLPRQIPKFPIYAHQVSNWDTYVHTCWDLGSCWLPSQNFLQLSCTL